MAKSPHHSCTKANFRKAPKTSKLKIIDSVPVPVVKLAREKNFRAFRKDFESVPAKGYSAVNKSWFIGHKLHVIIYHNGVVQQSGFAKGSVYDINYLKGVEILPTKKTLLCDRAYLSNPLQTSLFEEFKVALKVPLRSNQHDYKKHPKRYKY